mmetsp:Transcript_11730/g.16972  ORF Transcript_11730/g.16972 Transcript_11730/m.16972 type:complete len:205 (+) Transcript_11730:168-782(+)
MDGRLPIPIKMFMKVRLFMPLLMGWGLCAMLRLPPAVLTSTTRIMRQTKRIEWEQFTLECFEMVYGMDVVHACILLLEKRLRGYGWKTSRLWNHRKKRKLQMSTHQTRRNKVVMRRRKTRMKYQIPPLLLIPPMTLLLSLLLQNHHHPWYNSSTTQMETPTVDHSIQKTNTIATVLVSTPTTPSPTTPHTKENGITTFVTARAC